MKKSKTNGLYSVCFLWRYEDGTAQWHEDSYGLPFDNALARANRIAEENPGMVTKVE